MSQEGTCPASTAPVFFQTWQNHIVLMGSFGGGGAGIGSLISNRRLKCKAPSHKVSRVCLGLVMNCGLCSARTWGEGCGGLAKAFLSPDYNGEAAAFRMHLR